MNREISRESLAGAIEAFGRARVMVVGDVMLDQFIWGKVRRISPEAPVPVVEVERESWMLGGAANVVHNIVALGGRASICGVVGDDRPGRQVRELLEGLEVGSEGLVVSTLRPTTLKTRVVAHSQQVVRVDREKRAPLSQQELEQLLACLEQQLPACDAVVVSDYAKGVICPELMSALKHLCTRHGVVLTVDPKVAHMPLYKGATVVTPNHHEAVAAAGLEPEAAGVVEAAGRALLEQLEVEHVLVTRGEQGMSLFSRGEAAPWHIPTTAKKVFDVTGAGDTVIATLALAMATGLGVLEAAVLANLAAGIVVGEVGTSAVTAGQLRQEVARANVRLDRA